MTIKKYVTSIFWFYDINTKVILIDSKNKVTKHDAENTTKF
jgi:hypothetical protein